MKFTTLVISSLLAGIALADVSSLLSALSALGKAVDTTNTGVKGFDKSQGINGALTIQATEADIEKNADAVTKEVNALGELSDSDVSQIADAIKSLAGSVTTLLNDLTDKSADLISVGTQQIVQNDLTGLSSKTYDLEAASYKKVPASSVKELSGYFDSINQAFDGAFKAYDVTPTSSPPTAPSGGDAAAPSSAAASEAPSKSAAASEAPSESAAATEAAPSESAAATEAAPSESAAATEAAPSESAAGSGPAVAPIESGAANGLKVGTYGAAVAGFAALLL